MALFVYVLTLMAPVELSPLTTSDQALGMTVGTHVGRILGASLAFGLFGLLTWWLLHSVHRGSNLSRRILQIGWPLYGAARGLYEFFSYAASGMTALAIADLLVLGTVFMLWVRMALLLSGVVLPTRSVPHPNRARRAGEQGPVVVFRTEIPAFVATAVLVIVAIIQLAHDLRK